MVKRFGEAYRDPTGTGQHVGDMDLRPFFALMVLSYLWWMSSQRNARRARLSVSGRLPGELEERMETRSGSRTIVWLVVILAILVLIP